MTRCVDCGANPLLYPCQQQGCPHWAHHTPETSLSAEHEDEKMATSYAIIENGQPMDGQFYSRDELMRAIQYADYDATIVEFDLGELASGKSTPMRDLTEDLTVEWWHHEGINETCEMIEAGKGAPGLAYRYFSDECAAYEMRVAS